MKTVLFVCTANICRSPMAAAILRQRVAEMGLADLVRVESTGVWAKDGLPASEGAVAILAAQGIPFAEHRSRPLTLELLDEADIVLVMEEAHRRSIFYLTPQHLRKVWLLTELSGGHEDIADPFGGSPEGYANTLAQLEALIDAGLPRLLQHLAIAPSAADSASQVTRS